MRAGKIVGSGGAGCVVCSVESDVGIGCAAPSYIAEGTDYGKDLTVSIGSGEDNGVIAWEEAWAAGSLGVDKRGGSEREEGRGFHGVVSSGEEIPALRGKERFRTLPAFYTNHVTSSPHLSVLLLCHLHTPQSRIMRTELLVKHRQIISL